MSIVDQILTSRKERTQGRGRLPEGDYPLKVVSAEDGLSRKGNPKFVINCLVWDKDSEFHKAKVNLHFTKSVDFQMKRLYETFALAGAGAARLESLAKGDKAIMSLLEDMEDEGTIIVHRAVHDKTNDQYNKWYPISLDKKSPWDDEDLLDLSEGGGDSEPEPESKPIAKKSKAKVEDDEEEEEEVPAKPKKAPKKKNPFLDDEDED